MSTEKTQGEKNLEKQIAIDQLSKSRFGVLFTLHDVTDENKTFVRIECITYGTAHLNEFTQLVAEAEKRLRQIIEDSINADIERTCPSCEGRRNHQFAG